MTFEDVKRIRENPTAEDVDNRELHKLIDIALEKQIPKFVECPKGFQGVRDTRFYCPNCNSLTRQREEYCHKCGQAVKYPKEIYIKAENRIALDWGDGE